ncbi:hypothetical protein RQM65_08730 [Pricia sp. S334]|uniref:Outer membrane protein beta-barrel domain-containing protein n=1 Tax=Pricia mediterranea TaxID=3076079 RepID=A0ABU3L4S7_9FLAO|nr:hypothetical protein [Pricia sp. S334]MDT7828745.1 hypothetical protein [Pricia sp. S334]
MNIKRTTLLLLLFGLNLSLYAQDTSVDKSIFGVQTGVLGLWIHNESRLVDQIALRSEIGLDAGLFGGSRYYNGTGFLLIPTLTLEPRWYYNLNKRSSRSRNIDANASNFVSLKTSLLPDWFVISNYDDIQVIDQITIIPTWGIKRNIGPRFNYEAGLGIGDRFAFAKSAGFAENEGEAAANLHLRIGYRI